MAIPMNPFGTIHLRTQIPNRKDQIYVLEISPPTAEESQIVEQITYNDFGIITTPIKRQDR